MMLLRSSGATDVGLQRSNNEDTFACEPQHGIWVVADGMGGHAAGEIASQITAQTIIQQTAEGINLSDAIRNSHLNILRSAENGEGEQGMGSTVVALKSKEYDYEICWVGDSRAYLWQDKEKRLDQLSIDHSYVQMLYQSGAISKEELSTHPEKNIITQCLGSLDLEEIRVDSVTGTWPQNAQILLCSDGLTDLVNDLQISDILSQSKSLDQATQALVCAALEAGGKDNITVQLVNSPEAKPNTFDQLRYRIRSFTKKTINKFLR